MRPDDAEALSNRGITLQELKRFEEALASYDRALTCGRTTPRRTPIAALTLHELKRFEEALASYDRALAVRPDYAEALYNRGVTLHELKRFEEALASYDRALTLRPDYAEALYNRGDTLQELKRFDEALASYDRALKLRPDYAEAHNNLGVALMELGHLSEARAALEKAVQLAPRRRQVSPRPGRHQAFRRRGPASGRVGTIGRNSARFRSTTGSNCISLWPRPMRTSAGTRKHSGNGWTAMRSSVGQITYDEAATLGMLDRVRAVFTSELIRTWQNVGHPSPVPVFIVGMPRSGSTLVEQILASHPQVFGGGELKYFGGAVQGIQTTFGGSATFPELVSA